MGFLARLSSLFSSKPSGVESDGRAMYFYVRCDACGEKIRVRVDSFNDLAQDFDDNDKVSGYKLEKEVMGSKCFRRMHLHVLLDAGKHVTETSVDHGALITKEEFLQQ